MMRSTAAFLALILAAPTVARAADPAAGEGLEPLAWLAGSCWTGTFEDGETRDVTCCEWMRDGKFPRARYRVIGGPAPYSGETILVRSRSSGALEFYYFQSLGGVIRVPIEPEADGLRFPDETVEMGGETYELRSLWRRAGDDRYVAVTEKLVDGAWGPLMAITFERSGPASNWSED